MKPKDATLTPDATIRLSRHLLWAMAIISLAGIGLSTELTRIHYLTHTDPSYHALCAISDRINCETVALSTYSIFLGVPVSAWGMLAYSAMAFFIFWGLRLRKPHQLWPLGFLSAMSGMAVCVSAFLGYLSITVIDSICIYCNGLYLANTLLFIISIYLLYKNQCGFWSAFRADLQVFGKGNRYLLCCSFVGILLAANLLCFWPPYWKSIPSVSNSNNISSGVTSSGEPWIGSPFPSITILEFTDYQCPYCRKAHQDMRRFLAQHSNSVRLIHKHYPLDNQCNRSVKGTFHERACEFSKFTICAGKQGKFWPANDEIFTALGSQTAQKLNLEEISTKIQADWTTLRQCMSDTATDQTLQEDIGEGIKKGVRATPTYFVNGRRFEGIIPPDILKELGENSVPSH